MPQSDSKHLPLMADMQREDEAQLKKALDIQAALHTLFTISLTQSQ